MTAHECDREPFGPSPMTNRPRRPGRLRGRTAAVALGALLAAVTLLSTAVAPGAALAAERNAGSTARTTSPTARSTRSGAAVSRSGGGANGAVGYGVDSDSSFWSMSQAETDRYFDLLQASHARWLRMGAPWSAVQPGRRSYDWRRLDSIVLAAQKRGIALIVIGTVNTVPPWAAGTRAFAAGVPARDPADYGNYVAALVNRYKDRGVDHWEMGNEPNLASRWAVKGGPNPADYVRYLKAGYMKAKQADRNAVILTAGLGYNPDGNGTIDGPRFIKGIYAAGGKGYFDAISYHPYDFNSQAGHGGWDEMISVRSLMLRFGDGNKRIWATEFGVPDKPGDKNYQSTRLKDAYARAARYGWLGPMCWFSFRDSSLTGPQAWQDPFGLVDSRFRKRPAYFAYSTAALRAMSR